MFAFSPFPSARFLAELVLFHCFSRNGVRRGWLDEAFGGAAEVDEIAAELEGGFEGGHGGLERLHVFDVPGPLLLRGEWAVHGGVHAAIHVLDDDDLLDLVQRFGEPDRVAWRSGGE